MFSTRQPTVSVVVPTLDEAENIDRLLVEIFESTSPAELDLEVVVVDDGSTDGTRERVREWEGRSSVRLLARDDGPRGLAEAVLEGVTASRGNVIVVMDGDLSHPAGAILDLVTPILDGSRDMVVGSRYVSGGSAPGWPLVRRLISGAATFLGRLFTDVRDPMSGFFAMRRESLLRLGERAAGFKICLEILARSGEELRVVEVPITFRDRTRGESKLKGAVIAAYVGQLASLAGARVSRRNAAGFALVGLIGLGVDVGLFQTLFAAGVSLASSHMASFLAATLTNYVLNARWVFKTSDPGGKIAAARRYVRFLLVCLLALFLRGGVLAFLARTCGWPPWLAVLAAIVAAAAINYLGSAFFVFSRPGQPGARNQLWRVAAVGVVAYIVLLRLAYMGAAELTPEEAYYWNYSQHLDIGYLDHPPMVAWIIWGATGLFGDTEFGVRVGATICWCVTVLFGFLFARDLYGRSAAFMSLILLAVLPFFFATGTLMTPDAPLTACWAAALYFLERALLAGRRSGWWGAGVAIGLGLLSKYTVALLGPAALIFLLFDRGTRRWLSRPEPFGSLLVALVLFSPVIIWNVGHDWASFQFQGTRRWSRAPEFSLHVLALSALLLMTPAGLGAMVFAMTSGRSKPTRAVGGKQAADRNLLFARVFTLVPLAVFVLFSVVHRPKVNWTGPLWLGVIPLIGHSMVDALRSDSRIAIWSRAVWRPTILLLMLFFGAFLHLVALGLPGVEFRENTLFNMDWRALARAIEKVERQIESATGNRPLTVGMDKYFLSSLLAFYDEDGDGSTEMAGRSLFGRNSLMYGYWFPPNLQNGKSLIVVSEDPDDLTSEAVNVHFERADSVEELVIRRDERDVGRYYYRVVHGYRSSPGTALLEDEP